MCKHEHVHTHTHAHVHSPDACNLLPLGVCLGVLVRLVSRLADPSRALARDVALIEVDRQGDLGTVRRRGVEQRLGGLFSCCCCC